MELIKDITKQFYQLLIMLGCASFVLWILFSAEIFEGKGVLERAGKIYASLLDLDELKNDGLGYVDSVSSGYIPVVKYVGEVQCVGGQAVFKTLFSVRQEDGSFVSGDTVDEWSLYLVDIKTSSGNSVLAMLTSEQIEALEEIPTPFIYDSERDVLYFHGSGIYVVYIKIYGKSGGHSMYEFRIPVEAS